MKKRYIPVGYNECIKMTQISCREVLNHCFVSEQVELKECEAILKAFTRESVCYFQVLPRVTTE